MATSRRAVRLRAPVALLGFVLPLVFGPRAATAQEPGHSMGTGIHFQSYSFDEALGTDVANLTLLPVAYTLPLGGRVSVDLYGAYALGSVEKEGVEYTLQGPVDTRLRASVRLAPWAALTAAVNLPTGESTHSAEEAVVASVLSTDVLGFREATWGTGSSVTTGLALARQAGEWGVGVAGSYRLASGFEPREGQDLTYEPGDEVRIRVAVDRNVGEAGTFTAGLTIQSFARDEYDGRNLFQAGNRFRGDVSYAFRTGRSTWALYATDVWREEGDRFLYYQGDPGAEPDSTLVVGSQNLLMAGLNGSIPLGSQVRLRPSLDVRYQSRDAGTGEGWLMGGGAEVPFRTGGSFALAPRGRVSWGQLQSSGGEKESLWGVEVGLMIRWQGR